MVSSLKCPVSSVPKLAVAETSEVQLCLTPVRRVPYLTAFIFSVIQSRGGAGGEEGESVYERGGDARRLA